MVIRLLSIVAALWAAAVMGAKPPQSVLWHSSNPIFNSSLHQQNFFVVRIGSRLRIECPKTASEVSIIYRVDRYHADLCELPMERQLTTVGDCRRPGETILVTFREFSPLPNGLEFKVDKDYYFITTSTGENTESGLSNAVGGLCSSRNMKLRFRMIRKSHHHLPSGGNDYDDATVSDNRSPNEVPEVHGRPIGQSADQDDVDYREVGRPPSNRLPHFPPFGISYWPPASGGRSPGTMAPLMSDSADRSDDAVEPFMDKPIQEGIDYKIEYRYDDVNGTTCLRPVVGLLLAFPLFLIFFNR